MYNLNFPRCLHSMYIVNDICTLDASILKFFSNKNFRDWLKFVSKICFLYSFFISNFFHLPCGVFRVITCRKIKDLPLVRYFQAEPRIKNKIVRNNYQSILLISRKKSKNIFLLFTLYEINNIFSSDENVLKNVFTVIELISN